ncbi:MAG: glycerophosphoryl diester phosphodiesterase, partial [Hyphomicrobiales bacterium]|nr:glycerophosphoryl diester phosphodiesterase [Hyphomicrobiales bacterium]
LILAELRQYDVGRLKPGTTYAADFPEQRPSDGARIPLLADVFALAAERRADHVRFNIETKITPTSGAETPDPETFATALAKAIRDAGVVARASVQSFDWRTLKAMRSIAPEIERVCLTAEATTLDTIRRGEPGPSPWTTRLDVDDVGGSVPRLVAAAGCQTWSPLYRNARPDDIAAAKALGLKVIPWTVNARPEMERLIALGVDGIITDYPDRLRAVMAARDMPLPPQAPSR